MSLEDFSRMVQGKRPKDRGWLDRYANSDEDGCYYDQAVGRGPFPFLLAVFLVGGDY